MQSYIAYVTASKYQQALRFQRNFENWFKK